MTVHDISYDRAPELFSRRDRMLFRFVPGSLRRAARVIAVSEFTRQDLCERYGLDPGKVVAIPNGVSERFRPMADADGPRARALTASTGRTCSASARCSRARTCPLAIEAFAGSWATEASASS